MILRDISTSLVGWAFASSFDFCDCGDANVARRSALCQRRDGGHCPARALALALSFLPRGCMSNWRAHTEIARLFLALKVQESVGYTGRFSTLWKARISGPSAAERARGWLPNADAGSIAWTKERSMGRLQVGPRLAPLGKSGGAAECPQWIPTHSAYGRAASLG